MERRLKEHIDEAIEGLENQITELQDSVNKVCKRLDAISLGLERQLGLILRLDSSKTKGGKKRSAAEAFEVIEDEMTLVDLQQQQQSSSHDSSVKLFDKGFHLELNNVQTHLESAIGEMKSGTFRRLANLDERIGAIEHKVNLMTLPASDPINASGRSSAKSKRT
ncbi:hypothetical protein CCMA1212_001218 [Trichoderma ghanense]|uniref:Uncharacterized protein n=1 Tax=Trichoderma ghanense TaxID=65468 RepID=A0ABY2HEP6_9HYPO